MPGWKLLRRDVKTWVAWRFSVWIRPRWAEPKESFVRSSSRCLSSYVQLFSYNFKLCIFYLLRLEFSSWAHKISFHSVRFFLSFSSRSPEHFLLVFVSLIPHWHLFFCYAFKTMTHREFSPPRKKMSKTIAAWESLNLDKLCHMIWFLARAYNKLGNGFLHNCRCLSFLWPVCIKLREWNFETFYDVINVHFSWFIARAIARCRTAAKRVT